MKLARSRSLLLLLIMAAIAFVTSCLAANAPPAGAPVQRLPKPQDYRDKNFDYFVSGDPRRDRARRTAFGVALMGGGGNVDAAFKFIALRAGKGHIVILRAVSDDSFDPDDGDYGQKFMKEWGPVASAETIVFHNREASSDPRVLAILNSADGIFVAGGDQSNYIRYWKGTAVQTALNAHIHAERPIGGSSAGLAILGHYSYTAFDGGSMESKTALANPFDAGMTLESDFIHAHWLESVMTDSHFSARSRLGRTLAFLARFNKDNPEAKVFGVGIDEKTALLLGSSGVASLAGGSAGSAWIVLPTRPPSVLEQGQPLSIDNVLVLRMDLGSTIDFNTRTIRHPGAEAVLTIDQGKPTQESVATKILMRDKAPPDEP